MPTQIFVKLKDNDKPTYDKFPLKDMIVMIDTSDHVFHALFRYDLSILANNRTPIMANDIVRAAMNKATALNIGVDVSCETDGNISEKMNNDNDDVVNHGPIPPQTSYVTIERVPNAIDGLPILKITGKTDYGTEDSFLSFELLNTPTLHTMNGTYKSRVFNIPLNYFYYDQYDKSCAHMIGDLSQMLVIWVYGNIINPRDEVFYTWAKDSVMYIKSKLLTANNRPINERTNTPYQNTQYVYTVNPNYNPNNPWFGHDPNDPNDPKYHVSADKMPTDPNSRIPLDQLLVQQDPNSRINKTHF